MYLVKSVVGLHMMRIRMNYWHWLRWARNRRLLSINDGPIRYWTRCIWPTHQSIGQIQRFIGEIMPSWKRALFNLQWSLQCQSRDEQSRLWRQQVFAAPMAKKIVDDCMQERSRYCREFPIERLLRDAKLLEIGGGTLESHQKNICRSESHVHATRNATPSFLNNGVQWGPKDSMESTSSCPSVR